MLKYRPVTVKSEIDVLIDRFDHEKIDKGLAFNFLLGCFRTRLNRGDSLTAEQLISLLESSLRFGKIR